MIPASDLETIITTAARSLVVRDLERPLAARVRGRLSGPRPLNWEWRAAAVAAALVLAVTASLPRPDMPPVEPVRLPLPRLAEGLPLPQLVDAVLPARMPAGADDAGSARADAVAPSEAEVAWMAARLPLLAEPAVLTVSVSQPEPVSVALLEIDEVVAPQLSVPPIGAARAPRAP